MCRSCSKVFVCYFSWFGIGASVLSIILAILVKPFFVRNNLTKRQNSGIFFWSNAKTTFMFTIRCLDLDSTPVLLYMRIDKFSFVTRPTVFSGDSSSFTIWFANFRFLPKQTFRLISTVNCFVRTVLCRTEGFVTDIAKILLLKSKISNGIFIFFSNQSV